MRATTASSVSRVLSFEMLGLSALMAALSPYIPRAVCSRSLSSVYNLFDQVRLDASMLAACELRVKTTSAKRPPFLRMGCFTGSRRVMWWLRPRQAHGGLDGGETVCHAHPAPGTGCPWTPGVRRGGGYGGPLTGLLCRMVWFDAHGAGVARAPGARHPAAVEAISCAMPSA